MLQRKQTPPIRARILVQVTRIRSLPRTSHVLYTCIKLPDDGLMIKCNPIMLFFLPTRIFPYTCISINVKYELLAQFPAASELQK